MIKRLLISFTCLFFLVSFQISDEPKTILFFGDSLTAGYGLSQEQAFPALIERRLEENGYNYNVINGGLSGETTAGGLGRISWILKKPVHILVLELGANDGLRGLPLEQTKSNLQKIINKVREKNPEVKIIIAGMMVPPNMGTVYSSEFQKIFPEIAKKNDAFLIPFLLEGVAGDKNLNLNDGIHPNVQGHAVVADNVWNILKKAI